MRNRILSILVSVSMALSLVPAVPFTAAAEDAAATLPSVTAFATKDQLMNSFKSDDASTVGKLVFGKNDQGKPQEWFIFGKDAGISGDNTMIFAAGALAQKQVFRANPVNGIPYDPSWGCDYLGSTVTEVAANHYGSSDLRSALQSIASDERYFTTAEQKIMNASKIQTSDWYDSRTLVYSITDVLYPLNNVFFILDDYCVGSNVYEVDWEYLWNYAGLFWTRQPVSTEDSLVKVFWSSAKEVYPYPVNQYYDARPAGNLDLSNVLFASAASGSASGIAAGTIASDKAMTLRMDGSGKHVGSAEYDASNGVIVADLDAYADGPVSLVVQGNDGTRDWYFSKGLSQQGEAMVSTAQIKAATGAAEVDLSNCKIWVERTSAGERMAYAVMAEPASINVTTISSVELSGMRPTAGQPFPATAECGTAGVSSTSLAVSFTKGGSAATGTAEWDTTYTAAVTLEAGSQSERRYVFGSSVSATVDGKTLSATFSPDKDGKITVTSESTTEKGSITGVVALPVPANNTFAEYYGFDGYKTLPTVGSELGSVATVEYEVYGKVACEEVGGVTWALAGSTENDDGLIYNKTPGSVNMFRWTIPASALTRFVATDCSEYDASTGDITGLVGIANKAPVPVTITESGLSHAFSFDGTPIEIDVAEHFFIDTRAGEPSYSLAGGTGGGVLYNGSHLKINTAGTYIIKLTTAPNGIYAAGEKTIVILVGERPEYELTMLSGNLDFDTATYGYNPPAAQTITVANTGSKSVMLSAPAQGSFAVEGLPTSPIASGVTVTLAVQPKAGLDAGKYSEPIVISADGASAQASATASFSITKAETSIGLSASASNLRGGGTVTLSVDTSGLPAGAAYRVACMDSEVAITAAGAHTYSVTLPNKTQRYAFRAYCDATENYGASQSDHVYVEVAYLEPPALPPALSFPVTGGSGGIQVGGQLVGSKALVPDIDQGSVEEVLKSGAQGALKLDLSGLGSPVTSAQLSKTTVGGLVKAGTQAGEGVESVTIAMDGMSIELDRQALASIEQQMGDSVEVGLEEKGAGELTAEQQQALARYSEMVKCVEASIKSARSAIHSFDGGSVSISVAFQPAEGANPACYKVVYVAEDGSIEYHDAVLKDGTLSFSSSHLSTYAIVYIEPAEETLALAEALEALPQAEKLKAAGAEAAVEAARAALEQVEALDDDQRALVDDALVANAQEVVVRGAELVAAADAKAAAKVKNKAFSVRAGKSKSIYFKTKASSAGTEAVYKKASGSKYITVSKSGKVTAKKGMKAGKTYTAKVKVTCGASTRTVKVTVRAK